MAKNVYRMTQVEPRTLLVGIETPYNSSGNMDSYYEEFRNLVKTNGYPDDHSMLIKLRSIDPGYFFTAGKLEEIKKICKEDHIELVVVSESISAQQERNLADYLDCDVCDRTRLILEIFNKSAHSAEGKTQVEIAILKYKKTRLAGKGKHLMQQFGMAGVRSGPGETLKEREKRYLEARIGQLKKELVRIQQQRDTQRKRRVSSQIPSIALVGYTNAGKSTILNALTKSNVLAEDKLFATLDTTTRELFIGGMKKGVISDTVGFIQNLPTTLIEAFKSTLSELHYADLLLVVTDIADVNWENHIHVVHTILSELKVNKEILYVFNKADKLSEDELDVVVSRLDRYLPHVIVSAQSKEGIAPLVEFLSTWQKSDLPPSEVGPRTFDFSDDDDEERDHEEIEECCDHDDDEDNDIETYSDIEDDEEYEETDLR